MMPHRYIFISVLFFSLASCRPDTFYTFFKIKNNGAGGICYRYSNLYPDTTIPRGSYLPGGTIAAPSDIIPSGQSYSVIKAAPLDSYFKSVLSDTMEIFIFDANIVQTTPWDTVLAKYLILKRYDLTLDSIKKMHGIITYP